MENYKKKSIILNRLFRAVSNISAKMYFYKWSDNLESEDYKRLHKYFNYGKSRIRNINLELKAIDKLS